MAAGVTVTRCKKPGFDYTTNAPVVLARALGIPTREAAYLLVAQLRSDGRFMALVESFEYWEPR